MGKSERRSRARARTGGSRLWPRAVIALAAVAALALFGAAPSALAFKFFASDDIGPVKASNGYHATVSTGGRRQRERGPQPDSPGGNADYYSTSATVSAKAVKAQFGDAPELGSIRMAFHVKKKKRIDHAGGCKGKAITEKLGAWKGTLTFTGEGGYTHLSVAKALGAYIPAHTWRCPSRAFHGTLLTAYEEVNFGPSPLEFSVQQASGSSKAKFLATALGGPADRQRRRADHARRLGLGRRELDLHPQRHYLRHGQAAGSLLRHGHVQQQQLERHAERELPGPQRGRARGERLAGDAHAEVTGPGGP